MSILLLRREMGLFSGHFSIADIEFEIEMGQKYQKRKLPVC